MKKEHKYAQLLRWIADGEVIERCHKTHDSGWHVVEYRTLLVDVTAGLATEYSFYRIKPKTIRIGAFDVPEPLRVAPKQGTHYWVSDISTADDDELFDTWNGLQSEILMLERGLIHSNEEGAEAMRNALLSLTKAPA